ncbi:baseplate J/gp47 family protein [Pseudomonas sp. B16120]|uniref:baseplate assembly protein n=1 Tax=Pseudomonas sp. B16120 TaxID=3235108 RepID=UPI003783E5C0
MSTVDLSTLPVPEVLEPLDFEEIYAEQLATFREFMGENWNASIESDPVVKLLELGAYRRVQERARVNDAAKALLLAYAQGGDLDQLAANVNVQRLVIQAQDLTTFPPTPKVMESHDALRERAQAAFEGLTTAGSRNSYIQHARSASALVGDATAESPTPAVVVVTVQHLNGDGTADQALLKQVEAYLSQDNLLPVADRIFVQGAEVINYRITAILHMEGAGSENESLLIEAKRRLNAWVNPRRRLGVEVARSGIDAQLHINGVRRVELPGWEDIRPTKAQAAYCTDVTVKLGD